MPIDLSGSRQWQPPDHWVRIQTIDAHAAGEPLRVIVGGWPAVPGDSILDRRRYCRDRLDHLRRALMFEPRGHADMYGCLIVPPVTHEADFGVIFMHNEGYSTMCGHGIIAVSRVAVETGMLGRQPEGDVALTIDTPAGTVYSTAHCSGGRVEGVSFRNVPSWVEELDAEVDVPGLGILKYDLAFGGAWYAYVDAEAAGVRMDANGFRSMIDVGMRIKRAVMESREMQHPSEADLSFLYGTIFVGPPRDSSNHSRNVCVFADGEVDRSPTGTGVSGRAAIHAARGDIGVGDSIRIESIIGTTFSVAVDSKVDFHGRSAIVPLVSGSASLTGRSEFWIDLNDPLREGFLLR